MKLEQFINERTSELESQYRKVEFNFAQNVLLGKNSVSSEFISTDTALEQEGIEANLSELEYASSVPFIPNGTLVRFNVTLPRKRKPMFKDYYFLWS